MKDTKKTVKTMERLFTGNYCLGGNCGFVDYFAPTFRKWNEEANARSAVAKVKTENTGRIYCLDPARIEYFLQDEESRASKN